MRDPAGALANVLGGLSGTSCRQVRELQGSGMNLSIRLKSFPSSEETQPETRSRRPITGVTETACLATATAEAGVNAPRLHA